MTSFSKGFLMLPESKLEATMYIDIITRRVHSLDGGLKITLDA